MLCRCRTCSVSFHTSEHPPRCPTCLRKSTVDVVDAEAAPPAPPGSSRPLVEARAAAAGSTMPAQKSAPPAAAPRLRGPSVEPVVVLAPQPAWVLFGFSMVVVVLLVIAQGLPQQENAWFNVGLSAGLLACLAGAAWAIERGMRGIAAATGSRRRLWLGASVLLIAGILGFAVAALYTDIARLR